MARSAHIQTAPTVVLVNTGGPNILVRLLWFIFLGLWLGSIATCVGYLLCLTVIALPIGLSMLNRLPQIMTLRPASTNVRVVSVNGTKQIAVGTTQYGFLLRAVYYLLLGWWLGGIWLTVAWIVALFWWVPPGLFLAMAFWMFDRVPAVMTLRKT